MKTFARALMAGLFATTLAFTAACGDDTKDPTPDTKADATETTPDGTVAETTPDATVPDGTADAETVAPTNSCTNGADLAIIQSGDKDPSAKAAACGMSCIDKLLVSLDSFETCVQDCMLNATLTGYEFAVSTECTNCYSKSVRCTGKFCGLNDPNKSCVPTNFGGKGDDSADCTECRADNGCTSSFFTCSGLTPPP